MNSLAAFLRARVDEDEQIAQQAIAQAGPEWRSYFKQVLAPASSYEACAAEAETSEAAAHIARWDPARALVEVEAKRQHIARWEDVERQIVASPAQEMWSAIRNELLSVRRAYALVLQDDAVVYAGHPDYQEEWRP